MKTKSKKARPLLKLKAKAAVAKKRRQFYSEISPKHKAKKVVRKLRAKKAARKATPTRELLAEISKVGKGIKRRVKSAF